MMDVIYCYLTGMTDDHPSHGDLQELVFQLLYGKLIPLSMFNLETSVSNLS